MPRPAARKFTRRRRDDILRALRAGNFSTVAARFAGIAPSTFYRWLRRGKAEPEGPHGRFRVEVMQALAFAETRAVANIVKRFESDWRAALAYLERKFPRRWLKGRTADDMRKLNVANAAASLKIGTTAPSAEHTAEIIRLLVEVGVLDAKALAPGGTAAIDALPENS